MRRFGLDQDLELHDAYHVEVKRDYPVTWNGGPGSYVVDTYVFLPFSFGIGPDTFPAEQLFTLTQSYLRWRDDDFTYDEFMTDPERSPLVRLERGLRSAFDTPKKTLPLAHEARSAGCAARSFLKGGGAQALRALRSLDTRRLQSTDEVKDEVSRFLDRADKLLARLRRASAFSQQGAELLHADVVNATRLVDEYLSAVYDQVLAQLHEGVEGATRLQDGVGGRASLAWTIKEAARRESVYRAREGFCSLDVESHERRELYGFRLSLLKKYVSRPLYLGVEANRPKPTIIHHTVSGFAAALAAAWAIIAQTYMLTPQSASSTAVSAVTSALFAMGVIAYVLKDRMKEFLRETVMKRLRPFLPDRDVRLTEGGLEGTTSREIGSIQEQVRFVPMEKVPEPVVLVRNLGHTVDLGEERLEVILHHRRSVDLEPAFAHSPARAVRDILRLNVAPFLERLADPDQLVHHFDGRIDAFVKRNAPRVYHMNLVFQLAPLEGEGPIRYERIRVVLSQRGIIRVDEAVPLGTLDEVRSLRRQARAGLLEVI